MDKHEGSAVPQALQQHLQQLSQQFSERLRQELPHLAQLGGLLLEADDVERKRVLLELRHQLHRLAGSAGTFGFTQLGQQARELEQHAERWMERQSRQQQGLNDFISALQALGEQPINASASSETSESGRKPPRHEDGSRTIYILEGEAAIGESMRQTLNNFGYQAEHFNSIAGLDAALQQQMPDALIIDAKLPGEASCGLHYASQLRERLEEPLPLLVLTDQQDDFATQLQAVRAGAMGLFSKPVDIPQLESRLERQFRTHVPVA